MLPGSPRLSAGRKSSDSRGRVYDRSRPGGSSRRAYGGSRRATTRDRVRRRPAPKRRAPGVARRRPNYALRRAAAVLVLLLAGLAAYLALGRSDAPESAIPQLTRPVLGELEEPAPVGVEIVEATDDTWEAIAEHDPSPSLAVLGETYDYGRQVALTFDDGPDPNVTPAVLDVLREHELEATFFVVSFRVARNPEILRRIVQEGHTLGNHTYTHANLADLSVGQMRDEMQSTQEAVDRALGYHYPMTLMRPPYGAPYFSDQYMLPLFQRVMREQRAYPVMWTVDSRDWELDGQARSIANNMLTSTNNKGGVILLHDTHESTAEALPQIIARYAAAGFSFTTAREMLADKYDVGPNFIQASP